MPLLSVECVVGQPFFRVLSTVLLCIATVLCFQLMHLSSFLQQTSSNSQAHHVRSTFPTSLPLSAFVLLFASVPTFTTHLTHFSSCREPGSVPHSLTIFQRMGRGSGRERETRHHRKTPFGGFLEQQSSRYHDTSHSHLTVPFSPTMFTSFHCFRPDNCATQSMFIELFTMKCTCFSMPVQDGFPIGKVKNSNLILVIRTRVQWRK